MCYGFHHNICMLPFSLLEILFAWLKFWISLLDFCMRFRYEYFVWILWVRNYTRWNSELEFGIYICSIESREELRLHLSTLDLVVFSHSVICLITITHLILSSDILDVLRLWVAYVTISVAHCHQCPSSWYRLCSWSCYRLCSCSFRMFRCSFFISLIHRWSSIHLMLSTSLHPIMSL